MLYVTYVIDCQSSEPHKMAMTHMQTPISQTVTIHGTNTFSFQVEFGDLCKFSVLELDE